MINKEREGISASPEEIYAAKIAKFAKRREEILSTGKQISTPPAKTFWERFFGTRRVIPQQVEPSPGEQIAALEKEFSSWLFADRHMVVYHLKANPDREEEILAGYLQSEELLKDANTLGEFFAFWLREFFQKVDTGPVENLLSFIKNSAARPLPSELHQARREIFEPLFAALNGKEREIFKNITETGLFVAGQNLAKALLESNPPLPEGLKEEYRKYVDQLVKTEAGIIPVGPAEPEPEKKKTKPPKSAEPPREITSLKEPIPPTEKKDLNFFIVLGTKPENGTQINNLEELRQAIKKIKRLGPVTPEKVWECLNGLSGMNYQQIMERYGERATGGPFESWHKIPIGRRWCILFEIQDNNNVVFRVGSHEDVYATQRRTSPDRARRRL